VKAQKFTVLVVDDSEDDRFFIERSLHQLKPDYRIIGLASGNEAIAYIRGDGQYADREMFQFPSYVITDLKMPDGDGFELLDFIKQNPALSIIPVVMLSASQDTDDIRQAYLLGASCYFAKPSAPQEMSDLIKRIHDYWSACEVPAVDQDGYALITDSGGKLSDRYAKPRRGPLKPAQH